MAFSMFPRSLNLTYDPWIWSKVTSLSATASVLKEGRISLELSSFYSKKVFSKVVLKTSLASMTSTASFYQRTYWCIIHYFIDLWHTVGWRLWRPWKHAESHKLFLNLSKLIQILVYFITLCPDGLCTFGGQNRLKESCKRKSRAIY